MCSAQKSDLNSVPNQRMPHNSHNSHAGHTGSSGDDLSSTDEVKIYKDEGGDREDEKISSENLLEEKSSLIDLTESEDKSGKHNSRQDHSPVFGKCFCCCCCFLFLLQIIILRTSEILSSITSHLIKQSVIARFAIEFRSLASLNS